MDFVTPTLWKSTRRFWLPEKTELDAHYEVSRLLGHERPDVTDIYLASLNEPGKVAASI